MSQIQSGIKWSLPMEHRERLLHNNQLRLSEWLSNGKAKIVKQGPHRTVYEVHLEDLHFFVKHHHPTGTTGKLRQWLRPNKASREHRKAIRVAQRGVATIEPLGFGEAGRTGKGESFFLSHAVESSIPLSVFLEQKLTDLPEEMQRRYRQLLAKQLARLLATMHQFGILHKDLHPANILLQWQDPEPRLLLIDLDQVRLQKPLSWKEREANLIVLNRWFQLRASPVDRLRFWKAYCAIADREPWPMAKAIGRDIEEATVQSNLAFWRKMDERCLQSNRRFRRVKQNGIVGQAVTDLPEEVLQDFLRDPDAPFTDPGARLLKDSRTSTVAEMEIEIHGRKQKVIYKRFNVKRWTAPLASLCRPTPALRSWTQGHGLRQRWLPTPRPLLVLHRQHNGMLHEGYLLTAKLEPTEELNEVVDRLGKLTARERMPLIRRLIEQVAGLVRDLHQRHVSQRDLKACNLLVVTSGLFGELSEEIGKTIHVSDAPSPIDYWPLTHSPIWLIDLVGVSCTENLSRERKIQNLTRLHVSFREHGAVSRTEKLRFLRAYMQWGLRGKEGWKHLWRAIEKETKAKVSLNARSGRPLA